MKKLIILSTILAAATLMSGCHTYSKTGQTVTVAPIVQSPVFKADYDVNLNEIKTGSATARYLFGFLRLSGDKFFAESEGTSPAMDALGAFGNRVAEARAAAVYKALDGKTNSYLLNPQYKTAVSSYIFGLLKTYRVDVTGYSATLKSIRQVNN